MAAASFHHEPGGSGDNVFTTTQTFGGAGSPLRPRSIPAWLIPVLWVAGAAAALYAGYRLLRGSS